MKYLFKQLKTSPKQQRMSSLINVKVKNLRSLGYDNLEEWMSRDCHVYIGRARVVFINGSRFPSKDSVWANPFKINDNRKQCIEKYKTYITEKLKDSTFLEQLMGLQGKILGCWCKPEMCHGDILISILNTMTSTHDSYLSSNPIQETLFKYLVEYIISDDLVPLLDSIDWNYPTIVDNADWIESDEQSAVYFSNILKLAVLHDKRMTGLDSPVTKKAIKMNKGNILLKQSKYIA